MESCFPNVNRHPISEHWPSSGHSYGSQVQSLPQTRAIGEWDLNGRKHSGITVDGPW